MPETRPCPHGWHEELVQLNVQMLDLSMASPQLAALRERVARLLARRGRYNVAGDGRDDLIADERLPKPERVEHVVAPMRDFRTAEQRAEDAKLTGTWWRCEGGHVLEDALVLCDAAYCADPTPRCSKCWSIDSDACSESGCTGAWVAGCARRVISVGSTSPRFTR